MLNKWNISEHNHTWLHTISTLWHMWHMKHICYTCFSIVNKLFKSIKMLTVQSRRVFQNCTNVHNGKLLYKFPNPLDRNRTVTRIPGYLSVYSWIYSFIWKWESENKFERTSGHFRLIQIWLWCSDCILRHLSHWTKD